MPTVNGVSTDFYALLGVDASVSGDDLARAFRARAKELHPDTSDDPDAAHKFNDLVAAYGVLSNHRTRRDYDIGRVPGGIHVTGVPSAAAPANGVGAAPAVRKHAAKPWSRRKAWTALVVGALVALIGVGAAVVTWDLHQDDARLHAARFRPVSATRVDNGEIMFVAGNGKVIRTHEPEQHGEGNGLGPTVNVRYDPADPAHVIVDASTLGRDITLAVVALKFLIGGVVFAVLGARRLRALTAVR